MGVRHALRRLDTRVLLSAGLLTLYVTGGKARARRGPLNPTQPLWVHPRAFTMLSTAEQHSLLTTGLTEAHRKSENRNQGSQDLGRKTFQTTPGPVATACNITARSPSTCSDPSWSGLVLGEAR